MLSQNTMEYNELFAHLRTYNIHPVLAFQDAATVLVDNRGLLAGIDTIYISPRVSTDAQADKGYSHDTVQLGDCERVAEPLGKKMIRCPIYAGESGRTSDQPTFIRHLTGAKQRGRTAVMRWSFNRILRPRLHSNHLDIGDLEHLASYGVPILCAMPFDASDDWLRSRQSTLIAEHKKNRGEQYAPETYLPPDATPLIIQLKGTGLRAIARELNRRGMKTKTGCIWRPTQVTRVLEEIDRLSLTLDSFMMYQIAQGVTDGLKQ